MASAHFALSLSTRKFQACVSYCAILQSEVETFRGRMAFCNRRLKISPRYVVFNLRARGCLFLPALNSLSQIESSKLLLGQPQSSGRMSTLGSMSTTGDPYEVVYDMVQLQLSMRDFPNPPSGRLGISVREK
jgi:hypothetical protein